MQFGKMLLCAAAFGKEFKKAFRVDQTYQYAEGYYPEVRVQKLRQRVVLPCTEK